MSWPKHYLDLYALEDTRHGIRYAHNGVGHKGLGEPAEAVRQIMTSDDGTGGSRLCKSLKEACNALLIPITFISKCYYHQDYNDV